MDDRLETTPGPRNSKKEWAMWMVVASAIIGFYMSGLYLEEGIRFAEAIDSGEDEYLVHGDKVAIGLLTGTISVLLLISAYRIERMDKVDLAIGGLVFLILLGVVDLFVMDVLGPFLMVLGSISLAVIYLFGHHRISGDAPQSRDPALSPRPDADPGRRSRR